MNWYLMAFQKYATFSGRSRRKEYWYFALFNLLAVILLSFVDVSLGAITQISDFGLLGGIYSLITFIPSLALSVRRLHDVGRSGWWILLMLIPFIGLLVLLVFACLDSQPYDNQYGPNPKGMNISL